MPTYKAIIRELPDGSQVIERIIFEPFAVGEIKPFFTSEEPQDETTKTKSKNTRRRARRR